MINRLGLASVAPPPTPTPTDGGGGFDFMDFFKKAAPIIQDVAQNTGTGSGGSGSSGTKVFLPPSPKQGMSAVTKVTIALVSVGAVAGITYFIVKSSSKKK